MGDEYKNEEVYVTYPITDYVVTDHGLRITHYGSPITDHRSPITDYASRNMSQMKDKTVSVVGLGYVGLPLANAFVIENK